MENSIPWIEKYRPNIVKDIMLEDQVRKQINIFLKDQPNTHLIITGPPGVGKTTTIRCIAKEILGEHIETSYLELNAAEDRGVKTIGAIVPAFCMRLVENKKSKFILLDEADNITEKCQYDINEMMKKFGHNTKFVFTCNDSTKIIQDIQSVCRIIRYSRVKNDDICSYLASICDKEGVEYNNAGMEMICYISNGDMRKAINNLQVTAYSYNKITKKNVLSSCKVPDPEEIQSIINTCIDQNFDQAIEDMNKIINDGYYYLDIVTSFHVSLAKMEMKEELRIRLYSIVNETKIHISNGLRTKLQLTAMICRMINHCK